MKTSQIVLTSLSVLGVAGIGYAVYFDHRRRTDATFRKNLRKESKRTSKAEKKAAAKRTQQEDGFIEELLQEVRAPGAFPSGVEEREQYFLKYVSLGEQLFAMGTDKYLDAAAAFFKALKVYPQPVELIMIYQKAVPKEVFDTIMRIVSKEIATGGAAEGMSAENLDEVDDDGPSQLEASKDEDDEDDDEEAEAKVDAAATEDKDASASAAPLRQLPRRRPPLARALTAAPPRARSGTPFRPPASTRPASWSRPTRPPPLLPRAPTQRRPHRSRRPTSSSRPASTPPLRHPVQHPAAHHTIQAELHLGMEPRPCLWCLQPARREEGVRGGRLGRRDPGQVRVGAHLRIRDAFASATKKPSPYRLSCPSASAARDVGAKSEQHQQWQLLPCLLASASLRFDAHLSLPSAVP